MATVAEIYVNPGAAHEDPSAGALVAVQAQLVACRAYAAGRGYRVQGVFANLAGGREGWLRAGSDLLEGVRRGAVSGLAGTDAADLAVVVYDGSEMLDRNGAPDPVGSLIAAYGVRVESALPPHTVAAINTFFKPDMVRVWSATMRALTGAGEEASSAGHPFEPAVEAAPVSAWVWESLLHLLADEGQLRRLAANGRRPDAEEQARWRRALEDARSAEAKAETARSMLLDLLLEEQVSRDLISLRRQAIDEQLDHLRRERRQAHAHVAAGALSPEAETLVIEICRRLHPVLEGLSPDERGQAAHYLQLHGPAQAGDEATLRCLLPLVDESQRVNAQWVTHRRRGRTTCTLVTPPAGAEEAAEDYPLVWTASQAAGCAAPGAAGGTA